MFSFHRQFLALFLAVLGAVAVISCAESSEQEPQVEPTATFSPADATATWDAFKPELDRMAADILEQQSAQATVIAATALAVAGVTPKAGPSLLPTPTPLSNQIPERAVATGTVNRIAFTDGLGSILTVNPDGSGLATVAQGSTASGEFRYTFPVWSPDGGTLSFSSLFIVEDAVGQTALHRADADGSGTIVTLAVDDTSQSGVGPGVPHFSTWAPDGERIALTTSGSFGIGAMLLGSYSGERPKGIAIGAPLYVNWAPDGSAMLIHQDAGLHIIPVNGNSSGVPSVIGNGSIAFNSAAWAPDSQSFAHVESLGGKTSIALTQKSDLKNRLIIGDADVRVGLGWSPDGQNLAIARSSGASFHTLSIFSPGKVEERVIFEGEVRAFWWSPDSSKLAIIEDSPDIELAHMWSVLDVESGDVTPLVTQVASDEFLFIQVFFDQYADSHYIWSPDSSKIVIAGALLDVEKVTQPDGAVDLPETFDSQIWVLDASGIDEPLSVGRGTIASWSPH